MVNNEPRFSRELISQLLRSRGVTVARRRVSPTSSRYSRTSFKAAAASGALKSSSRYSLIALVSIGFSVNINSWILSFCSSFSARTGLSAVAGSLPSTSSESSEIIGPVA